MTTIALIDDHLIVRSGFAQLLGLETDFQVVAEFSSGREALAKILGTPRFLEGRRGDGDDLFLFSQRTRLVGLDESQRRLDRGVPGHGRVSLGHGGRNFHCPGRACREEGQERGRPQAAPSRSALHSVVHLALPFPLVLNLPLNRP